MRWYIWIAGEWPICRERGIFVANVKKKAMDMEGQLRYNKDNTLRKKTDCHGSRYSPAIFTRRECIRQQDSGNMHS